MYEALVLDIQGRPVKLIPAEKAVVLVWEGKATALAYWNKFLHSPSLELQIPKVISINIYVPLPEFTTRTVTNTLLFARDNYTCQYCGRHESELEQETIRVPGKSHKSGKNMKMKTVVKRNHLTRDHVKPVCQHEGKTPGEKRIRANNWENCVTACKACNNRKDDKTPAQAGMKLIGDKAPKRPHGVVINLYRNITDPEQRAFVDRYMRSQEKRGR